MKTAAAVALLLFSTAAWVQDKLPDEEEKLFKEAGRRNGDGLWQEAERLFKSFLEKHPTSGRTEEVLVSLARLNRLHRDCKEARRFYAVLFEKFPRSERYWDLRLEAADTWNSEGLAGRALDAFREIVNETKDSYVRSRATLKIWEIKGKRLDLRVNQCFVPGERPEVHVYRHDVKEVTYRAYRLKDEAAMDFVTRGASHAGKDSTTPIKEWSERYDLEHDNNKVEIPATERGIYILEAEHERAIQTVTAFIGRFGIVAKSAAQKLVCFVQDRTTLKPVEGATIRVLSDERPFLGKTDARGLFVTMGYQGGSVVGEKDGEVFFARSYGDEERSTSQTYIVTDRPIYRPRQKVHFRVIQRDERGRELSIRAGLKVVVRITYQWQHEVYRKTHTLSEFGSTEGEFLLGETPYLGEYTIHCQPESEENEWGWGWGYGSNSGNFRVDEYRKPEFKVQVDFKKPHFIKGEKIEGAGKAEYYFGGPVAEARVSYQVYFRRYDWGWRSWAWYYDWYFDEEDDFEVRRGDWLGDEVLSDEGKTDKDGNFKFDFDNFIDRDVDGIFTVVAEVTDLSRRVVSGAGSCRVAMAEFGLSMTLNKYVFKRGDPIRAKVRATTLEEKPVPGTKIVLRAYDKKWNDGRYERAQIYEGSSVTDASGLAEFSCTEDVIQGFLILEAEATDSKNRVVKTSAHAWRTSDDGWNNPMEWESLDIVLDKKTYDLGETARILVTSQHKNGTFLLTVEGSEVYHQQVVTLKGHTAVVDYKIERPELAPNVHVTFTGLHNRDVLVASKSMIVNPSRHFLTVEIKPDRTEYRPRQKARYEVRTLGADGAPVAAEVMVGIVDDSIYALQEEYAEDIRKKFFHRRWNEVSTTSSMHYYAGGKPGGGGGGGALTGATFALEEPKQPSTLSAAYDGVALSMDEESGGGGKPFAATEIRSRFADTMLWRTVTTDAQGKAVLEVDLADNVTTWRATARAHTRDSRFGQETNSVLSRKNIIVRVETPRFLTQNDEAVLSAVVHNNFRKEKELRIEFAAQGVEAEGARTAVVRIPAGGQKRFDWKSRARAPGTATITAKALGTEDSDAMEVSIPVLPHGLLKTDGSSGIAAGRVTEKVVLPAEVVPGSAELTVTLSPVHASMVLDALDSLAGYPYGCVEQTMSRFLPTVVVSRALSKLGISKPKLEAQLPLMVSSGFQRLRSLQNPEGGWGWWGNGDANGWITAYVVTGLALAHEAGYSGNEDMLDQGLDALWRRMRPELDVDEQVYLLSAISSALQARRNRTGTRTNLVYAVESHEDRTKDYEEIRDRLAGQLAKMKPHGRALMAIVLHRDGKDAKPALAELARGIRDQGTHARVDDGERHYGWMDDGTEATAMALQAFVRIDPKHPLVVKLANGLSMARRGSWWVSTRQTAMAVYALVDYLAMTGELNPDMTLSLTVNGEKLFSERVTRANWAAFDGVRKIPSSKLKPGVNEIVIEQAGTGTPSYSTALRYHVPAENIAASKGALRVDRRYSRIHQEAGQRVLVPIREGEAVESGEEIEVTLNLESDARQEWLMLADPLPAGFEPVREYWGYFGWAWDYWYDHKEFHDQYVSIAMNELEIGGRTVSYTMRAETPGDFHAMPARIFNMYRPEIGGHSAEARIKVVDRK